MADITSFHAKKVLPSGESTQSVCWHLCVGVRQFADLFCISTCSLSHTFGKFVFFLYNLPII